MARAAKRTQEDALDVFSDGKRSSSEQVTFKASLQTFYNVSSGPTPKPGQPEMLTCMLLNQLLPKSVVRAAHIFPRRCPPAVLVSHGLLPSDVYSPRNGLLLTEGVEWAFDRLQLGFLYDAMQSQFVAVVFDPDLLVDPQGHDAVVKGSTMTFRNVQGLPLRLGGGQPFRRLLRTHFLAAARHAVTRGWIEQAQADLYREQYDLLRDDPEGAVDPLDVYDRALALYDAFEARYAS